MSQIDSERTGFERLPLIDQLSIVRHGTVLFARMLDAVDDGALDSATLLPDWTRRHLVAHVSYNALALGRLLQWAETGIETPMYSSPQARAAEIAEGAVLDPHALRKLFADSVIQLDARWNSLPTAAWNAPVRTVQGRVVPAAATIWLRAREVWIHATDLNFGAGFDAIPDIVLDGLLTDMLAKWRAVTDQAVPPVVLAITGRKPIPVGDDGAVVRGDLSAIVRWLAGRGDDHLLARPAVTPPRWL
ncbi:maleylpyruvate isomerase family mycothiol-dependent enzyme [Mycolicibacterium sphagni]|uniref:maleylpyruvate isomerase family mycothiol-dependent enzyme n=1 Tax=Mycolicibacterium sphagni TaxID=1786 RepID=UPI0021F32685|nr:maleylpyruvate isomerase family mycothiol-dependent enzyme [Mycolicibacterium sphagni]MCV7177045.1 maleylpyruvate isomerase family mycothiol-dependent enzyme [Mycolicibacterium sphagni]